MKPVDQYGLFLQAVYSVMELAENTGNAYVLDLQIV
jgi:hypothetical protein